MVYILFYAHNSSYATSDNISRFFMNEFSHEIYNLFRIFNRFILFSQKSIINVGNILSACHMYLRIYNI